MLIEIKPKGILNEYEKERLEIIAGNYILQNSYDWGFKIVHAEDILLTPVHIRKLAVLLSKKDIFQAMIDFQKMERRYNKDSAGIFSCLPYHFHNTETVHDFIRFVRTGKQWLVRQ